jgi:hypothetical protein
VFVWACVLWMWLCGCCGCVCVGVCVVDVDVVVCLGVQRVMKDNTELGSLEWKITEVEKQVCGYCCATVFNLPWLNL